MPEDLLLYDTLPHRPIYDSHGLSARVRSVLWHASDEWYEFLKHDRRGIAIWLATTSFVVLFAWFWSGREATMREVLPGVAFAAFPTVLLAGSIWVWCLFKAPYQLKLRWALRELAAERTKHAAVAANLASVLDEQRRIECRARPRPRVHLTTRPVKQYDSFVTGFCVHNGGDAVAIGVSSSFKMPHTAMTVSFSIPTLLPDESREFMPELLGQDGKLMATVYAPLDAFLDEARKVAMVSRSVEVAERVRLRSGIKEDESLFGLASDAVVTQAEKDIGLELGKPDYAEFDVVYHDFGRQVRYRTTHALSYDPKRVALSHLDSLPAMVELLADRDPEFRGS